MEEELEEGGRAADDSTEVRSVSYRWSTHPHYWPTSWVTGDHAAMHIGSEWAKVKWDSY